MLRESPGIAPPHNYRGIRTASLWAACDIACTSGGRQPYDRLQPRRRPFVRWNSDRYLSRQWIKGVSDRDPAWRGFLKFSLLIESAPLRNRRTLADGLMLVLRQPVRLLMKCTVKRQRMRSSAFYPFLIPGAFAALRSAALLRPSAHRLVYVKISANGSSVPLSQVFRLLKATNVPSNFTMRPSSSTRRNPTLLPARQSRLRGGPAQEIDGHLIVL
jgi:hypothetical protein